MLSAARLGQHPWPVGHRRLVTHVLPVAASQVGHPIAMFVLMVPRDRLVHPLGPGACQITTVETPVPASRRQKEMSNGLWYRGQTIQRTADLARLTEIP